jgi:hypothetical protein
MPSQQNPQLQILERVNDLARRVRALEAQEPEGFLSGAGAPAVTPAYIGQWYLDTTNDVWYRAADTASSADFKALN